MQKKAQFWYSDFLLALLILVGISILFISSITDLNSKQDKLESISSDASSISSFLMSEGYCQSNCQTDWSNLNGRIGFVKEGKVNQNNLLSLINLDSDILNGGYNKSKILLGTRNNYIFYFENSSNSKIQITSQTIDIYGKPEIRSISEINSTSLIKTTRFVYLDNAGLTKQIVKLVVIVW